MGVATGPAQAFRRRRGVADPLVWHEPFTRKTITALESVHGSIRSQTGKQLSEGQESNQVPDSQTSDHFGSAWLDNT
jgi:hypothetical protein